MPDWLSDASANRHIKTYVKDFLDVSGNFTVRNNADYAWNSYGQVISGVYDSDGGVYFGITVDMDASGNTIIVGGNKEDDHGYYGAARVYKYDSDADIWYQHGPILTPDSSVHSNFSWQGVFISDDGSIVAVNDYSSASTSDGTTTVGKIYVFQYNSSTNTWDTYGSNQSILEGTTSGEELGHRGISMSGDGSTIAAADRLGDLDVRIFKLVSGSWTQIAAFSAGSVDIVRPSLNYDGSRVVMNYISSEQTYVFDYSGTSWSLVGSAITNTGGSDTDSHTSINKEGNIIAVHEQTNQTVKIYQYDATVDGSWKQLGTTLSDSYGSSGQFGEKMRLNAAGDMIIIGNRLNSSIQTYKYQNGDWSLVGSIIQDTSDTRYGRAVAISDDGTKIVAGGYLADVNGSGSGYVQAWQWSAKSYGPLIDISGETVIFGKDIHKDDPNYYNIVQDGMDDSTYGVDNVLYGQGYYDYFGAALAMNANGTRMIVGANKASYNATEDGYATIYKWQNGRWGQMGKPISQSNSYHRIGNTVDMNDTGNMIVLGKQYGSSNNASGAIEAYEFINGDWAKRGSTIDGSTSSAYFGFEACAMDGTGNVIAGMDIIGKVRVYQYVEGNSDWSQLGSDISISSGQANSNNEATKRIDLSQDGSIIVIGDVFDDTTGTNNGRLSVYKFTGDVTDGSWNLIGDHITITTSSSFPQDDRLGQDVSINSDGTIVAGTSFYYNSEEGRTFIFKYSEEGGVWAQLGTDIGSDQMPDDDTSYNARSVALSGDGKTVTIGHSHDDTTGTNAGSVSAFRYADGNWTRIGTIYGRQSYGYLRYSCISRDGTRFAAGTRSTDDIDTESGSVMTASIINYLDGAAMKITHDSVRVPKLEMGNEWTTDLKNIYDGVLSIPMMTLTGLSSYERDFRKEWGLTSTLGFSTDMWGFTEDDGYENATYLHLDDNQYYEHDLILRGAKRTNNTHDNYVRYGYALISRYQGSFMFIQTYSNTDTTFGVTPNKRLSLGLGANPGPYGLYVLGNANSSTSWGSSDDRLKHNEEIITNGLEVIRKLAPRHYYKTRKIYDADHNFDLDASGNPLDASGNALPITEYDIETGFIAQEVKEISELAHTFQKGIDDDQPHGLQYTSIFVWAIKALQELDEKVQQRQAIITSLEEKIQVLENA